MTTVVDGGPQSTFQMLYYMHDVKYFPKEIKLLTLLFFNCYSIIVVPVFSPLPFPVDPTHCSNSQFPHCCPYT